MAEDNITTQPASRNQQLVDPAPSSAVAPRRALVLGGGGATGNAWEIGVLAGLCEAGLDVTDAEVIIGTSAGATVAAQVSSRVPLTTLYNQVLTLGGGLRSAPVSPHGGPDPTRAARNVMQRTAEIIANAADPADMRRRIGAAFLEGALESDFTSQWRASVATRLPNHDWPTRRVLIVAVDAHTGEPIVFDSNSGVELVDSVAASTSNGRTYGIAGRRYIDGGYRRNENADLAAGYERVLVLSPFGGRSRHPLHWRMQLAAQLEELRDNGSTVETVFPAGDSERMFGPNAMDLSLRPAAARAGKQQGQTLAEHLDHFWR